MTIYLHDGRAYNTVPRKGKPQLEEADLQMQVFAAFKYAECGDDMPVLDAIFDAGYTIEAILQLQPI